MLFILRLIKWVTIFVFATVFAGIAIGIAVFYYFSKDLPKLASLKDYAPPVISEVYSDNGTKVGEFWLERRIVLPPDKMPPAIVQALVASEDDRFFEHRGLDFEGMARAMVENLKAGKIVQGGSTITQQITKSLLLSREKTFTRKIKEAILATRIERNFTKEEILYLYLNQTFFGNRSYGVEAAAQNYFHKTAQELTVAEAALIAGLAKAPSTYSPILNPVRAKERQEYVLMRMQEEGYITMKQFAEAKAQKLHVYKADTDKDFNLKQAPWFVEYVRRYIQKEYGENVPYTHGLKIYTTLDLAANDAAQSALERGLRELDKLQGYVGPVRKLTPQEFEPFLEEQQIHLALEAAGENLNYLEMPAQEELAETNITLDRDRYYKALILALDKKSITVGLGKKRGKILQQDYRWARKRNLPSIGWPDASYVNNPEGTFVPGDLIWVQAKQLSDKEMKMPEYSSGEEFFTLEQQPEVEGALYTYDPLSGSIKAIIGGRDFSTSEFNRATQSLRQPGSAFKPFIYAAALDKGYTPETTIVDSPVYFEWSPGLFWSPKNYDAKFEGPIPFRRALILSRNVPTVKILMDIGVDYVASFERKLGITTPIERYYSLGLGANAMKLEELARAYGTFPTGGRLPELKFIKSIVDRYGSLLEIAPNQGQFKDTADPGLLPAQPQPADVAKVDLTAQKEQPAQTQESVAQGQVPQESLAPSTSLEPPAHEKVGTLAWEEVQIDPKLAVLEQETIKTDGLELSDTDRKILYGNYIPEGHRLHPKTAHTMVQLMRDVVEHGTGTRVKALKRPAAGKTGTTNDETDAWFIGYVPDLVAGVWVGFDHIKSLGHKVTGGKVAAPIFLHFMADYLKDKPVAEFKEPEGLELPRIAMTVVKSVGGGTAAEVPEGSVDFFATDF